MNILTNFARRQFLGLVASGITLGIAGLPSPALESKLKDYGLWGPPAGPSITLAHAVSTGRLGAVAQPPKFTAWRTPDELLAGLSSGQIIASVVPAQLAANLYNRAIT